MTSPTDFDPIDFLEMAVDTPSHENVDAMRELLRETLDAHGVESRIDEAGNVLASRGSGSPHLVLNTHVDTVSPHVPLERDDGIVRGRGSCDAKGPLAAMLGAFLAVESPPGQVTLAVTPDEETGSTGAIALDLGADAYVVGEPTGLDVCNAARGRTLGTVTVRGANAHAAEPEAGVNAITAAGTVLAALGGFDERPGAPPAHPSLGGPTLTPTVIDGGGATNQVPDECRITIDRRTIPPETPDAFAVAMNDYLRTAVPDVDATYEHVPRENPFSEAFETPENHPIVGALQASGAGAVRPFTAATEASFFALDTPTVVFGPGELVDDDGPVAHAPREYVRTDEVYAALETLIGTIRTFQG